MSKTPTKCGNSPCTCVCADGNKFCSQSCQDARKVTSLNCHCPHTECKGH